MDDKYLKKLEYDKIIDMLEKHTDSQPGKKIIGQIRPLRDINSVNKLLEQLSSAIYFVKVKGKPGFEGLEDITGIIKRLNAKGVLNNRELLIIKDNSYLARHAYEVASDYTSYCKNEQNDVRSLFDQIIPLYDIEREIRRCILSEDEVADEASVELLSIRKSIFRNREAIKDKLQSFVKSERYKKYLQDSIVTIRNDRYVVPVKNEYRHEVKGIIHDTSQTGSTLFIEPAEIVNINNKIRELLFEEQREIERILKDLSQQCAVYTNEITSNFNTCVQLDVLFAKASFGLSYKGTVPHINNDKKTVLKNARHPLINAEKVVPIDFSIGEGYNILVITGPNTGGKTVSLKTVGLITAMSQSGFATPADEGSVIGIFNDIFVDIGDEQSIEQNLSTFSSHMTNIIDILKYADSDSLVLLDELGAGTDPVEGSALALAIIDTLKEKNITSVATTHYSELKTYASVTEGIENASCEFDVKTLNPTYRLLIGIPGKSNALYISGRLGLSKDIIEKAKGSIDNKDSDYEDVILALEKSRQRMEKDRKKATDYKKEIETIKKDLEKQRKGIDKERQSIIADANKKAKKILEKAFEKAEQLTQEIEILKKSSTGFSAKTEADFKTFIRTTRQDLFYDDKNKDTSKEMEHEAVLSEDIKQGDTVMLRKLNQKGDVITPPDKNGDITVQVGIIKMNVNVKDVYPVDEQKTINERLSIGYTPNLSGAKMELDIRGNTIYEAHPHLDTFIEKGYLAGLHELTVIHGKGTGALRKGVWDYLKDNAYVKSFRSGKYGEGEAGVTVIILKEKK